MLLAWSCIKYDFKHNLHTNNRYYWYKINRKIHIFLHKVNLILVIEKSTAFIKLNICSLKCTSITMRKDIDSAGKYQIANSKRYTIYFHSFGEHSFYLMFQCIPCLFLSKINTLNRKNFLRQFPISVWKQHWMSRISWENVMFQIYKNALLHVRLTSCIFSHDKEEMMTTQILQ